MMDRYVFFPKFSTKFTNFSPFPPFLLPLFLFHFHFLSFFLQTRVDGGLKVTRALGDLFTKQILSGVIPDPFLSPVMKLEEGEAAYLIIASDGVWK